MCIRDRSLGGDGKMNTKNRITIRMPIELNLILTEKSIKKGVSKNSLILQILWDEVNKNL